MIVDFHDFAEIDEDKLKYAVIVTRHNNQWVYVKHKKRETWEIPGGHREPQEKIVDAAKRELHEETGAINYNLQAICVYSVSQQNQHSFGGLFFADVFNFSSLPNLEIEEVSFNPTAPRHQTYPKIQPFLLEKVVKHLESSTLSMVSDNISLY